MLRWTMLDPLPTEVPLDAGDVGVYSDIQLHFDFRGRPQESEWEMIHRGTLLDKVLAVSEGPFALCTPSNVDGVPETATSVELANVEKLRDYAYLLQRIQRPRLKAGYRFTTLENSTRLREERSTQGRKLRQAKAEAQATRQREAEEAQRVADEEKRGVGQAFAQRMKEAKEKKAEERKIAKQMATVARELFGSDNEEEND